MPFYDLFDNGQTGAGAAAEFLKAVQALEDA
jgi:hypothetical protein